VTVPDRIALLPSSKDSLLLFLIPISHLVPLLEFNQTSPVNAHTGAPGYRVRRLVLPHSLPRRRAFGARAFGREFAARKNLDAKHALAFGMIQSQLAAVQLF
jgi:hypothetical protein